MGLFGPPNVDKMKAQRDINGLIKALGYQKDAGVRMAAADALGQVGEARVVEPLIAALNDRSISANNDPYAPIDPKINVGKAAAGALGQLGDARAVEPLIALLQINDTETRTAAAGALGQLGDARAVAPLIPFLKDFNYLVGKVVVEALVKIGPLAVEPLIAALWNEKRIARQAAAVALGQIGDARAVEPLIAVLGEDGSEIYLYEAAAVALGQLGDTRAIEPLIAALKKWSFGDIVCKAASGALDELGWRPSQDEIGATYWVIKREWDKCIEIGAPAVAPLIALLKYNDAVLRKAAIGALAKIGPPAVELLIAAFRNSLSGLINTPYGNQKDGDRNVAKAAPVALGQIGDARAVEPLTTALNEKKLHNNLDDAVWTAVEGALDQLGAGPVNEKKDPATIEKANEILGAASFFGPDEWQKFFGYKFELSNIPAFPWTEDDLRNPAIKQEHFLFLGLENLEGMSLDTPRFTPGQSKFTIIFDWYVNQVQTFTGGIDRFRWYHMPVGVVKYSWKLTYSEEEDMLPAGYEVPTASERLTANILFHLLNGKYLDNFIHWARTRSQSEGNKYTPILRMCIGFPSNEEELETRNFSEDAVTNVGLAASRKIAKR